MFDANAVSCRVRTVSGRQCLTGYIEYGHPLNISYATCLVRLSVEPSGHLVIPHAVSDNTWSTGAAVMNISDVPATVHITAYDTAGVMRDASLETINAHGKIDFCAAGRFPTVPREEIASISVTTLFGEAQLVGVIVIGTRDFHLLSAMNMPAVDHDSDVKLLPHVASSNSWCTGIGVTNPWDTPCEVIWTARDSSGAALDTAFMNLQPHERKAFLYRNLFPAESAARTESRTASMESVDGRNIGALFLLRTLDDRLMLMGDTVE